MPKSYRWQSTDVIWTGVAEGHLGHNPPRGDHDERCCGDEVAGRRQRLRRGPWTHVAQVHGNEVKLVDASSQTGAIGECEADGLVTDLPGVTLSISTADCAPIALSSREGVVGALHGGYRSLQSGIVGTAAAIMRRLGATDITAALGPCIHVDCYEFDEEAMRPMVSLWGEAVRGETSWGTPALNLPEAVRAACKASEIELVHDVDICTGCDTDYFSYRMRKDGDRQVMLVMLDGVR